MVHIVALIGVDGVGKTTQALLLVHQLIAEGVPARYWQNAGGRRWFGRVAHRFGKQDADDLLGIPVMLTIEGALRWLAIGRALLTSRLRGEVAVMDRYSYCQYARIRAHGRRERITRWLFRVFPQPDRVLHLVLPPTTAHARVTARGTDDESPDHLARLDREYRRLPDAHWFVPVDAAGSPAQVHSRIRHALSGVGLGLVAN